MFTRQSILRIILSIPAILIAFTFHEYAHALVADKLGDKTPKFQGRLTLNPIAHIDIAGFIMILLVGFGWAKPVETNPSAFKNYYKDDLKVSIAGPIANFLVAFVFSIFFILFIKFVHVDNTVIDVIKMLMGVVIQLNCVLFFLNLLPIPGFDGFHILKDLFPKFVNKHSENIYKYQFIVFIVLILPILPGGASVFDFIVGVPARLLESSFIKLVATIFGVI